MRTFIDYIALFFLRSILGFLNLLPLQSRLQVVRTILRTVVIFVPNFKKVSLKNIALVFPHEGEQFHKALYERSFHSLSRVLVDVARLHTLSPEWIHEHIKCPYLPTFLKLKEENENKGILIATGHLGSFELMAHAIGVLGHPIDFVARNFTLPRLDRWWKKNREQSGNRVIDRQGAVKKVLNSLQEGRDVALLFDQNVKRNHAVFVPWFGRIAATTMTIGLVAVRTRAKVVVASMHFRKNDSYEIVAEECPCEDIYDNQLFSTDEMVKEITLRATQIFERMILESPEGWFWMHRRWKTQPDGEEKRYYD